MQEDFIHYLWKHRKFDASDLKTTNGKELVIISSGEHNHNSGPDFFNAQLRIADQLWAGNVEMHLRSSDWFVHHHETDKAYDNVILHVVWEHDTEVFGKGNTAMDTLELQQFVPKTALDNYQKLFSRSQRWINCESDFASVDEFLVSNWLERLFFERLERKSVGINEMLTASNNDWEAVLFKMLAKGFGLKVNGASFLSIANSIEYTIIRKECGKSESLEALFFGQAGLFIEEKEDAYFNQLKEIYNYQKHKYDLNNQSVTPLQFFRLRPSNFPTLRWSQLAQLYHQDRHLFSRVINADSIEELYDIFRVETSSYWETHFTFGKSSSKRKKRTTDAFIDLLLINTIIPLKFSHASQLGRSIDDDIIEWASELKPESNSIVDKFNTYRAASNSAMHSQALIELKTNYCDRNKCLQCAIGNSILTN